MGQSLGNVSVKQLVQNYRTGDLRIEEVPPPAVRPGGVLVRNAFSLISAGTERSMIELARKSLLEKARSRPDLVRKVLEKARTEGPLVAYQKARERLDAPMPLGYSSAGVVIEVGEGVCDLRVGDSVACAGIGYASHAEVVFVPRNLCVKVPTGTFAASNGGLATHASLRYQAAPLVQPLGLDEAAYTTVGAIALEAVRVSDVRLGEAVVVIGLGLVGLLAVQILKAAGCRVLGLDIDASRCRLAERLGADAATGDMASAVAALSAVFGLPGADAVLVTAASESSQPLLFAGELARDRGRVVVVGSVGTEVPRKLYYEKALEVRMSRSYGPGRYERLYEEKGVEYPIGYVRWTENRNMQAFLQLLAERKVDVRSLTTHRFAICNALDAYALITERREPHVGVLLSYPEGLQLAPKIEVRFATNGKRLARQRLRPQVGLGVIGAGGFARAVLLPALRQIDGVSLRGICSQGGLSARAAAERYGFEYCCSDPRQLFDDPGIDGIVIATRPGSHAALAVSALEAGKKIFVEKPLAVNLEQLRLLAGAARNGGYIFVGFNRRYSPFARHLKSFLGQRRNPLVALYRVSANFLRPDDWQHDIEEGGGRIVGEAAHFVDLLSYLVGTPPESVWARAIGGAPANVFVHENAALTLSFNDGSLATIIYTTQGSARFPKERLEVFFEGATAVIDDFRRLECLREGRRTVHRAWLGHDKGHRAELSTFVETVRSGDPPPVSLRECLLTTLCTLRAVESLRTGELLSVDPTLLAAVEEAGTA